VEGKGKHPVYAYAERVNELLHAALWSSWFYRHEIYEVPNVVTALLITYDDQRDDAFVHSKVKWKRFLRRMSRVKKDWAHVSLKTMKDFSQTDKTTAGWEGRTIYFIKGTSHPDRWTPKDTESDTLLVLQGAQRVWGPLILDELKRIGETIAPGRRYFRDYENQVRVTINFLFLDDLSEAKAQVRTEPSNGGVEIRDLICQNRADSGFWKDLKDIREMDFQDELSRFKVLVDYMFARTMETNGSLNRLIVYTGFNCICKTDDARQSFILLFDKGLLAPAFSLTRMIFELWAAACYVDDVVRDFHFSRDGARLDGEANRLFGGTRYPAKMPWGEPTNERPVPIGDMLDSLEPRHPQAAGAYGFLCEYCHPNYLYNMRAFLATRDIRLWENPLFRNDMTTTIQRQLAILLEAVRGIKVCARTIFDTCMKEYSDRREF